MRWVENIYFTVLSALSSFCHNKDEDVWACGQKKKLTFCHAQTRKNILIRFICIHIHRALCPIFIRYNKDEDVWDCDKKKKTKHANTPTEICPHSLYIHIHVHAHIHDHLYIYPYTFTRYVAIITTISGSAWVEVAYLCAMGRKYLFHGAVCPIFILSQ